MIGSLPGTAVYLTDISFSNINGQVVNSWEGDVEVEHCTFEGVDMAVYLFHSDLVVNNSSIILRFKMSSVEI